MQLSTSVLSSDPSANAVLPPGMPGIAMGNVPLGLVPGALPGVMPGGKPPAFAELMPAAENSASPAPKKGALTPTDSAGEAVAGIWAGWLAAIAPTPEAPAKLAAWNGRNVEANTPGAEASKPGVLAVPQGEASGVPTAPVAPGISIEPKVPVAEAAVGAAFPVPTGIRQNLPVTPGATGSTPTTAPVSAAPVAAVAPMSHLVTTVVSPASEPAAPVPATSENVPTTPVPATTVAPAAVVAAAATPIAAAAGGESRAPVAPRPLEAGRPTPRAIRAAFTAGTSREKIADDAEQILPARFQSLEEAEKKILSINPERVTKSQDSLGIGAAMPDRTMFTNLFSHTSSGPAQVSVAVERAANAVPAPSASAEMASQAPRAVNVVLAVAERAVAANRPSVHLQFAVGGAQLSIKVELRAGEVHTTFRTDSSELRTALAAAWQSIDSETNRGLRLADAVFTPASASGAGASLGDGASAQRDPGSRQAAEVFQPPVLRSSSPRADAETTKPDYREAALLPNLNLYTFA